MCLRQFPFQDLKGTRTKRSSVIVLPPRCNLSWLACARHTTNGGRSVTNAQHGKRNAEIHDEMENVPSNRSGNREFQDVLKASLSRRRIVQGSLAGAAGTFLTPAVSAAWSGNGGAYGNGQQGEDLVGFRPVSIEQAAVDQTLPTISDDYEYQVLIRARWTAWPAAGPV